MDANMSASTIDKDKRAAALVTLDKLDKIGIDGVKLDLAAQGIPERSAETILYRMMNRTFLAQAGRLEFHEFPPDRHEANTQMLNFQYTSFKGLRNQPDTEVAASDAIADLMKIVQLTKDTSASKHIEIDPSLARGLSYYTWAIMEINVPNLAGSLGGGGRYDNLVGMFSKQSIPACGFSLGLERIIIVMNERNMFPYRVSESGVAVMVILTEPDSLTSLQL